MPCKAAFVLACLSLATCARSAPGPVPAPAAPICLTSYQIDHTDIPDDSTILFTMRDHAVWRNRLDQRCVGLRNDPRGFTYEPTNPGTDEICSNLVLIRLNTYGGVCALGNFEKIMPSVKR